MVLTDGKVDAENELVQHSIYHQYLEAWYRHFPASSIHCVDGESLAENPVPELQRVERFLNLQPHISQDMFTFDRKKGFFCPVIKKIKHCLAANKGRKHKNYPIKVITKLQDFYQLHNKKLVDMTGLTYSWLQK